MTQPNYEALGRYTHLCEQVKHKAMARNSLLNRAASVMQNAGKAMLNGERGVARRCNFEAMERLLAEAKQADAELQQMLEEVNALAPIADKPALAMA